MKDQVKKSTKIMQYIMYIVFGIVIITGIVAGVGFSGNGSSTPTSYENEPMF